MAVDHVVPFFAVLTCLGILMSCIWHIRAHNWTIVLLGFWLALWNFVLFLNAMIWWDDAENKAPVFCDISVKLTSMWLMGVPCAGLCVAKKLEAIASTRIVSASAKDKRRAMILDLFIAVFIPIIYSILSVVYQGHRFDIIGGIGCNPATYVSWPYILLGVIPPPLVALISLGYACMCLRHFIVRQKQFTAVLCSAGSNLNKSRYLRMMALCFAEIFLDVPLWIVQQVLASQQYGIWYKPYQSWAQVHSGFGQVVSVPSSIFNIPEAHKAFISSEISRWSAPVSGWLLILFFGFNDDAKKEYAHIWTISQSFCKRMIFRQKQTGLPKVSLPTTDLNSPDHPLELPPMTPRTDVSSTYEYKGDHVELYDHSTTPKDPFDMEYGKKSGVHVYSVKTMYGA